MNFRGTLIRVFKENDDVFIDDISMTMTFIIDFQGLTEDIVFIMILGETFLQDIIPIMLHCFKYNEIDILIGILNFQEYNCCSIRCGLQYHSFIWAHKIFWI